MALSQQLRFLILGEDSSTFESIQASQVLSGYAFEYLANPYCILGKLKDTPVSGLIMPLDMPPISGLQIAQLLRGDSDLRALSLFLIHKPSDDQNIYRQALALEGITWLTPTLIPEQLAPHLERLQASVLECMHIQEQEASDLLQLGELAIDVQRYEFRLKNEPIQLTPIEFKLLKLFIERRGRIQTREHLLNTIWGYTSDVESRTIDTHVRRLREKLKDEARRIQTVRGVGYKLIEDN